MLSDSAQLFFYRWLYHLWCWRLALWLPALGLAALLWLKGELGDNRYRSHTVMLLQESALANPFLKDMSVAVQLKQRLSGLRALLGSRQLLQEVAEHSGLIDATSSEAEAAMVRAKLRDAVSMEVMGDSLVRLQVIWPQAALAQTILTSFSVSFQRRLMAPGQRAVEDSQRFLQVQLQRQEQSLNEVEQQLASFKQQNAALLPDLLGANNLALLEAETKIRQQRIAIEGAQSRLLSVKNQLASASPLMGEIEQRIVRTQTELAQLKGRYTPRHSAVKAVQARLSQLQSEKQRLLNAKPYDLEQHLDNLWQLASTIDSSEGQTPILVSQLRQLQQAQNQLAGLQSELELLQQHRQRIGERMSQSAAVERKLAELERLALGRRELYQELLVRYEKARVTSELGMFEAPNKIQVIDAPNYPSRSLELPWFINVLFGLAGGLALGIAWATIQALCDQRIYARVQLQQLAAELTFTETRPSR
ncbi:hypothetical protein [uncultured Ferrimonas sp.]|uniref:GumC family protein n=1 Tax=uncultured Ferrimonas sp. TaxID=432640 RepID=UPI00260922B1|nr:hypothetical protein [uncultured Ferrimonas sp.]